MNIKGRSFQTDVRKIIIKKAAMENYSQNHLLILFVNFKKIYSSAALFNFINTTFLRGEEIISIKIMKLSRENPLFLHHTLFLD